MFRCVSTRPRRRVRKNQYLSYAFVGEINPLVAVVIIKKKRQVFEGVWEEEGEKEYVGKNVEIKSETDEWTAGTRNEVIQREMKGEREDDCSVTFWREWRNWKIAIDRRG